MSRLSSIQFTLVKLGLVTTILGGGWVVGGGFCKIKAKSAQPAWDQEKSSSGKKFESPKKSNFFPLELFSSNFFLVHIELEVLQRWLVPNHKEWNNKVA